jgi:hypothetical protein
MSLNFYARGWRKIRHSGHEYLKSHLLHGVYDLALGVIMPGGSVTKAYRNFSDWLQKKLCVPWG